MTSAEEVTQRLDMLDALLEPLEEEALRLGVAPFELAKVRLLPGAMVLSHRETGEVRKLLGGAINSGPKLIDMIRRLKSIKLADRSIEFSASRLEALEYKARAMGMSLDDALPQIADVAFGQYLGA